MSKSEGEAIFSNLDIALFTNKCCFTRIGRGGPCVVMGTGNPGVSPKRPQPVPLNTLTLGAGRGILWVRVWVWWGFKGIRVASWVIVGLEALVLGLRCSDLFRDFRVGFETLALVSRCHSWV